MSLTATDLSEIRNIVKEEVNYGLDKSVKPILGELKALSNDIKEIYQTKFSGYQLTD